MNDHIYIQGAREHNLKNISLTLPRNKLIVITGLSGSGKSSLAFDTLYAEGQRRYVESLSSYARQFLEQLQKPDVDHIDGLSPAIAIEQRSAGGSLRSIVATQTEIYDYLRLLFARVGRPVCWQCGQAISKQTSQEIVDRIMALPKQSNIVILSPVIRGKKGTHEALFKSLLKEGFARVRVNGEIHSLDEDIRLEKYKNHSIDIAVDRTIVRGENKKRITDSVEAAIRYSGGQCLIRSDAAREEFLYNTHLSCAGCGISVGELQPRTFSFNSPYGACPACNGLGIHLEFDPDLIVPDKTKTLDEGAIEVWRKGGKGYIMYYKALLREYTHQAGVPLDIAFGKLAKAVRSRILQGDKSVLVWDKPFEGVIPNLERVFKSTDSEYRKTEIARYMSKLACPACSGKRLKKEALSVYLDGLSIWDVVQMSIEGCSTFFSRLRLTAFEEKIAVNIIKEIKNRLAFCLDVGLSYLSLDRLSLTLSGGEAQRIRLATQVGSALSGVIYILDEPTIGLHPRDDSKLIKTLRRLKDLGNTVVIVEHDEQMIKASDWVVDLGPGAGTRGGEVVYSGTLTDMLKTDTLTARYLRKDESVDYVCQRRQYSEKPFITIRGACEHNLKNIDVRIPLESFVCVTGVSGSGKSTLVEDILYKTLARHLYAASIKPGAVKKVDGLENIDKVIIVDQSPIGRTPRSNPATYTGVFSYIREVFSRLPEARARGYSPARFSFNVSGGRCEACAGDGTKKIEMHFLPDVFIPCEVCQGKRFNRQTLEVTFKGKSVADVLNMEIDQAHELFINFPRIKNILQTLKDVGLGYIALGQSATTLSGGEAQRIKLASQLRKKATGKTLYILDEPTTGLHFDDVKKLLIVLQRLVDKKNSIVVIEHNLDVIKSADFVIDLGPEGGDKGGEIVASGTPEAVMKIKRSYTGRFLKEKLR